MLFLLLSSLLFSSLLSVLLYSFVFWVSLTVPTALALAVLKSSLQLDVEVMEGCILMVNDVSHFRTSLS